jgi:hypothetical protein
MKKINKHHLSALAFIVFGIIAYACTTAKPVTQTQESRRYSNKDLPVYKKSK